LAQLLWPLSLQLGCHFGGCGLVKVQPPSTARHGDGYHITASPPFRSRACWLALKGE
jgi:hypothetical protein